MLETKEPRLHFAGEHPVAPASESDAVNARASDSARTESLEVERKYEVPVDAELPSKESFAAAGFVRGSPETLHLFAQYFDTSDGLLARQKIAMRKRTGGSDDGWHLKMRAAGGTRELHWPLSDDIPAGLANELRKRIGEAAAEVRPIAELRTERHVVLLKDERGTDVVELADDRVFATELRGDGTQIDRAWREWEAELVPGADPRLFDGVEQALGSAGAAASPSSAKIARAMGISGAAAEASGAHPALVARLQAMDRSDRESARKLQP